MTPEKLHSRNQYPTTKEWGQGVEGLKNRNEVLGVRTDCIWSTQARLCKHVHNYIYRTTITPFLLPAKSQEQSFSNTEELNIPFCQGINAAHTHRLQNKPVHQQHPELCRANPECSSERAQDIRTNVITGLFFSPIFSQHFSSTQEWVADSVSTLTVLQRLSCNETGRHYASRYQSVLPGCLLIWKCLQRGFWRFCCRLFPKWELLHSTSARSTPRNAGTYEMQHCGFHVHPKGEAPQLWPSHLSGCTYEPQCPPNRRRD